MTKPRTESAHSRQSLFEDLAEPSAAERAHAKVQADRRTVGPPRVQEPNRRQVELRASDLDSLLGEGHRARLVWGYVVGQDLGTLLDAINLFSSVAPEESAENVDLARV